MQKERLLLDNLLITFPQLFVIFWRTLGCTGRQLLSTPSSIGAFSSASYATTQLSIICQKSSKSNGLRIALQGFYFTVTDYYSIANVMHLTQHCRHD